MKHFNKKSMKLLAVLLTLTFMTPLATPAFAWYGPPPPPVHHYHHDDGNSAAWGIGGLAAGLILGSVISNSNKERKPKEPVITDVEERLTAFSAQAIVEAQKAIAQYGIEEGLSKINDYWAQRSYDTIYDPIGLKLSVADSKNQFKLTYIIDRETPEIEVTVIHRASGKNSSRRAGLNPPDMAQRQSAARGRTRTSLELLGFSLADNRSNGYLTVAEVEEGTAAYYAGLRAKTPIVAIDGNKTTQMMHDQMQAYIMKRAETGNTVKVQFMTNGGVLKTVVLKPQL